MMVRDCRPDDDKALRTLYERQGFTYDFPDFSAPQFIAKRIVCDDQGNPVIAVCARRTVELYMLGDPHWKTPRRRFEALRQIHEDMRQELIRLGVEDVVAWLPPEVEKSFGRRLMRWFGWKKPMWTEYCAEVDRG